MEQFQTLYTNFHQLEGLFTTPWIVIISTLSLIIVFFLSMWIRKELDIFTIMTSILLSFVILTIVVAIGSAHQAESMDKLTVELNGTTVIPLNNIDAANDNYPIINNTMIVTDATKTSFTATSKQKENFNGQSAEFTITKDKVIPKNEYAEFMLKSEEELAKLDLDIDESSIKQESNYEFTAKTKNGKSIIISPTDHIKNDNNIIYVTIDN